MPLNVLNAISAGSEKDVGVEDETTEQREQEVDKLSFEDRSPMSIYSHYCMEHNNMSRHRNNQLCVQ